MGQNLPVGFFTVPPQARFLPGSPVLRSIFCGTTSNRVWQLVVIEADLSISHRAVSISNTVEPGGG